MKQSEREWRNKYQLDWYHKNKPVMLANAKKYRTKNRDAIINRAYVKRYGLTFEQICEMLKEQNDACAICSAVITLDKKVKYNSSNKAHVDHDHTTNRVRGLLCPMCNKGLGLLQDSTEVVEKALNYLRDHK